MLQSPEKAPAPILLALQNPASNLTSLAAAHNAASSPPAPRPLTCCREAARCCWPLKPASAAATTSNAAAARRCGRPLPRLPCPRPTPPSSPFYWRPPLPAARVPAASQGCCLGWRAWTLPLTAAGVSGQCLAPRYLPGGHARHCLLVQATAECLSTAARAHRLPPAGGAATCRRAAGALLLSSTSGAEKLVIPLPSSVELPGALTLLLSRDLSTSSLSLCINGQPAAQARRSEVAP